MFYKIHRNIAIYGPLCLKFYSLFILLCRFPYLLIHSIKQFPLFISVSELATLFHNVVKDKKIGVWV